MTSNELQRTHRRQRANQISKQKYAGRAKREKKNAGKWRHESQQRHRWHQAEQNSKQKYAVRANREKTRENDKLIGFRPNSDWLNKWYVSAIGWRNLHAYGKPITISGNETKITYINENLYKFKLIVFISSSFSFRRFIAIGLLKGWNINVAPDICI